MEKHIIEDDQNFAVILTSFNSCVWGQNEICSRCLITLLHVDTDRHESILTSVWKVLEELFTSVILQTDIDGSIFIILLEEVLDCRVCYSGLALV